MSTNGVARWLPLLCVTWLFFAACQKKEQAPAEATSATPVAPPVVNAPAVTEIADADLAVPEDFEDDAEKEISQSNYKAELGALEKELEGPE